MEIEERIAKWERVTMRFAGFIAVVLILLVALIYAAIEGFKFIAHRFFGS